MPSIDDFLLETITDRVADFEPTAEEVKQVAEKYPGIYNQLKWVGLTAQDVADDLDDVGDYVEAHWESVLDSLEYRFDAQKFDKHVDEFKRDLRDQLSIFLQQRMKMEDYEAEDVIHQVLDSPQLLYYAYLSASGWSADWLDRVVEAMKDADPSGALDDWDPTFAEEHLFIPTFEDEADYFVEEMVWDVAEQGLAELVEQYLQEILE